jgi:hypothetical protein
MEEEGDGMRLDSNGWMAFSVGEEEKDLLWFGGAKCIRIDQWRQWRIYARWKWRRGGERISPLY